MPVRARRSVLSVPLAPASSGRFLARARELPVDCVMLDLEDSVAPAAKPAAREVALDALRGGSWGERLVTLRVNAAGTPYAVRDVVDVVAPALAAGAGPAAVVLPKVTSPADVHWLDLTLASVEREAGAPVGGVRVEAQVEDARGLARVREVAACSPRLESLVFGPGDLMASLGMRGAGVGLRPDYPGDAFHHVLAEVLVAARANDLQAVDGPYAAVRDVAGFRRAAALSAALGYDGTWVLHPAQVDVANEVFTPSPEELARASSVLEAMERAGRGAVDLQGEMVDEATVRMARRVMARGEAAGLVPPPRPATGPA